MQNSSTGMKQPDPSRPITADQLTGVTETLMITLYARYVESQRSDRILYDPLAVEIAEHTGYNFDKYSQGWASQLGVALRIQAYDRLVQNFLSIYPNAIVINLGCGLCTRFHRVDNGLVQWYEIDFPEVIHFRRTLLQESDRHRCIASSILDFSWIEQIQAWHPIFPRSPSDPPFLILMEGVSPYLTEAENRAIFEQLHRHLAPAEVFFDVLNRRSAQRTQHHDTVSKTQAQFKSGVDDGLSVESWAPGLQLKQEIFYLTQFPNYPQRLPFWARYLSFILVPLFKNSGRILQVSVSGS